jgi:hypothetical protein
MGDHIGLDAAGSFEARAFTQAPKQVLQEFLRPVLGLGPPHGEEARLGRGRINMGNAPGIAIDHGLAGVLARARKGLLGEGGRAHQHGGEGGTQG